MRRAARGLLKREAGWVLLGLGVALLVLDVLAARLHVPGQLGIGSDRRLREFVALMVLEGAIYLAAARLVCRVVLKRRMVAVIILLALAMRGVVLAGPPFLSTDIHRYVWDGMVQDAGINPYRYIPDAPALSFLRTPAIYPGINRKDTARTIYPPAAEAIFALVARVSPTILAMRLAMTGFDLLAMLALLALLRLAGRPASWILLYAWHPLPIWEFAGNGHVDAIVVGFVAVALLLAARARQGLAAAALTGAVLAKFLPLALLPALWRPARWNMPAIMLAITVVLYAHYADVGMHVFGFLGGYVDQEGIASGQGIFWLLAASRAVALPGWANLAYDVVVALGLGGLGLAVWRRKLPAAGPARARSLAGDAGALAMALSLAVTPHYPWYFTWLLVPICVMPTAAGLYMTASAVLLYLDPIHTKILWPALVLVPALLMATGRGWSGERM